MLVFQRVSGEAAPGLTVKPPWTEPASVASLVGLDENHHPPKPTLYQPTPGGHAGKGGDPLRTLVPAARMKRLTRACLTWDLCLLQQQQEE